MKILEKGLLEVFSMSNLDPLVKIENLKKNKFHKFRSSQKPRNQTNRIKVPYFHLIKGMIDTKEAS